MKKIDKWFVNYVYKQNILGEKEKVFISTWGVKAVNIIKKFSAGIISFFVLRYIFLKLYEAKGFEETIITLIIIFIIMAKMGSNKNE